MNRAKRSIWELPSFRQFFGFASISTAVLSAIAIGCLHKREYDIKSEPYYKEAMKAWDNNKTAKFIVGEPIRLKHVEIFNQKNHITSKNAKFFIPITGQNYNGKMNVDASFKDDKWILNELSLELNNDLSDKKFIVFRNKKTDVNNDIKDKIEEAIPKKDDSKNLI